MYEDIKSSIRITDVLRRHGYNVHARESYRIPCPIHKGRDANFSVSERDGLWNCFSVCGRGGSVIDLVAALDGITIPEAVRKLREDYRLTPMQASARVAREYTNKNDRFAARSMGMANVVALPETTALEEGYRGLQKRTIAHWGLARTDTGVIIPHLNMQGNAYSYSIRRDDGDPKYENTKGVSKGIPFGLYESKQDIISQGFAWVVEGQLDAISLWQRGYRNVIALMGSSMTEQQAMLILVITSKLKILFDGDDPGRNAAIKIKKAWSSVFDIKIISIPDGKDPDELTEEQLEVICG